jgi:hypothetical protein
MNDGFGKSAAARMRHLISRAIGASFWPGMASLGVCLCIHKLVSCQGVTIHTNRKSHPTSDFKTSRHYLAGLFQHAFAGVG